MKGHGYSNDLLEACIRDAKAQGKEGICILCAEGRKREFLADPKFLAYKGFRVADISDCGINLMYLPIEPSAQMPKFREFAKHPAIEEIGFVLYYTEHLLLGAKGAGGGEGTWYPIQDCPHHRQRICAKCTRTGHNLCPVPGRSVSDTEYSIR